NSAAHEDVQETLRRMLHHHLETDSSANVEIISNGHLHRKFPFAATSHSLVQESDGDGVTWSFRSVIIDFRFQDLADLRPARHKLPPQSKKILGQLKWTFKTRTGMTTPSRLVFSP